MASAEILSALASAANGSPAEKTKHYNEILKRLTSSPESQTADNLTAYIDAVLGSSIGIINSRPLITSVIQLLHSAPADAKVKVGSHLATAFQSQTASFEEQDAVVREILAKGYETEEDYTAAAKALQGINLDTTQRSVSDVAKVEMGIRIVRYYLEDDDTVSAETALNRLKNSNTAAQVLQTSPDLRLHYQLAQARILDSRRDFLSASSEYLNVSLSNTVAEEDRLHALSAAIRCAVLAPAGPQRSKTLARLYKDERSAETEEFGILEKMFLDRLLSPAEVDAFSASLATHQLAKTSDGSTVLSKAVIEHNLLAASRLYENISTTALGEILGLKDSKDETAAEKAEDYAARMVEQGRLKGEIDQIDGVIRFEDQEGADAKGTSRELRIWDSGVQGLVEDVERCAAAITESYSGTSTEQMVH